MTLNINEEFSNPCGQLENVWISGLDSIPGERHDIERFSLEAINNGTNGQNWKNKDRWMIETDHCQWYGISCDVDGFVTSIDLRDNNLAWLPCY